MLPVRLDDALDPVCPHCNHTLAEVLARRLRHDLGKAYVHYCPSCRKVLGISHRKGFWMG
jgi:uncharacterized protein with PIN domain